MNRPAPFAGAPFSDVAVPPGGFGAIVADPPWAPLAWGPTGTGRSAVQHYDVMTVEDIAALPVGRLAARDCALMLWATWPMLLAPYRPGRAGCAGRRLAQPGDETIVAYVARRWGFAYSTLAWDWLKLTPAGGGLWMGNGKAGTRGNTEPCLLFLRGRPRRLWAGELQPIVAPVGRHSEKPAAQYDKAERLFAGPYLELFARQRRRPGWTFWGNELPAE